MTIAGSLADLKMPAATGSVSGKRVLTTFPTSDLTFLIQDSNTSLQATKEQLVGERYRSLATQFGTFVLIVRISLRLNQLSHRTMLIIPKNGSRHSQWV